MIQKEICIHKVKHPESRPKSTNINEIMNKVLDLYGMKTHM